MAEQFLQRWQGAALQHHLRLVVVASDDVAHGAQGGRLHEGRRVHQELHESAADAGLDHGRDALVRPVGEVGEGPAGVGEHLHVVGVDEVRERAQRRRHPLEGGRRLTTAEIREGPCGVPHHGRLLGLPEHLHDGVQATALQHEVAEVGRVAGDVPEGPDSLLADVVVGRPEEHHEDRQGAVLHDDARLLGRAGGDVREHPRRLELQVGPVPLFEELDEARHGAGRDHLLDRGVLLDAQELAELLRGAELRLRVARRQRLHQDGDLVHAPRGRAGLHLRLVALRLRRRPGGRDGGRVVPHALLLQRLVARRLPQLHRGVLALPPRIVRVDALLERLLPLVQPLAEARHRALGVSGPGLAG
mmetsp:Transcript_57278/g.161780  ORF Transcript_57278/g.161780 Transcript_57278/m.161780 type:complete len:360 (+) Transcript_57278:719-1798(+)